MNHLPKTRTIWTCSAAMLGILALALPGCDLADDVYEDTLTVDAGQDDGDESYEPLALANGPGRDEFDSCVDICYQMYNQCEADNADCLRFDDGKWGNFCIIRPCDLELSSCLGECANGVIRR